MEIFEKPGYEIKTLATLIFRIAIILGALTLVFGFIHMFIVMHDTGESFFYLMSFSLADAMTADWRAEGYAAKTQITNGLTIMLASLATIPLYGFGQLVEDVEKIRKNSGNQKVDYTRSNEVIIQSGGWKCSCGRVNAQYTSSCACGKAKSDN